MIIIFKDSGTDNTSIVFITTLAKVTVLYVPDTLCLFANSLTGSFAGEQVVQETGRSLQLVFSQAHCGSQDVWSSDV